MDLREREVRLGWGEVVARARAAAARLRAWGVAPGDRVAIVLRTEPAFLDAFFGAWLAGAVPVPLYPPVRLGRLEEYLAATARMLAVSGARLVLSGGGTLGPARRGGGAGRAAARAAATPRRCWSGPARRGRCRDAGHLPPPGALGLVQFSSGSTVDPKPVALTHAALQAQADALTALVAPAAADVLVSWLPLYHDMGLLGGLLGAMSYPGPLVLIPPEHFLARPALWLRAVARHRGTISPAPSFAYAYCADRVGDAELDGLDLRSWRLALDGAEPISGEALRRFAARFAPHGFDPRALMPVYGLSEAALAVTFAAPRRAARRAAHRRGPAGARRRGGRRRPRGGAGGDAGAGRRGRAARRARRAARRGSAGADLGARAVAPRRATSAIRPPRRGPWWTAGSTPATSASGRAASSTSTGGPGIWSSSAAPTTPRRSSRRRWPGSPGCGRAAPWRWAGPGRTGARRCSSSPSGRAAGTAPATHRSRRPSAAACWSGPASPPPRCACWRPARCRAPPPGKLRRREALRRWLAGTLTAPRRGRPAGAGAQGGPLPAGAGAGPPGCRAPGP